MCAGETEKASLMGMELELLEVECAKNASASVLKETACGSLEEHDASIWDAIVVIEPRH